MKSVPLLAHTSATVSILGGGPAGISCALWLKNLGHKPVILESAALPGGTPSLIDRPNRWIAGMPGITSVDLAKKLMEQCSESDLEVETGVSAVSVNPLGPHRFQISFSSNGESREFESAAIVLATGVKPRGTEALGRRIDATLSDKIDSDPLGHLTGKNSHLGERALVIGGADNAFFTANDLLTAGAQVTLVCRSTPKAQSLIQSRIQDFIDSEKLELIKADCESVLPAETGIDVALRAEQELHKIQVDRIYLRLGFIPRFDQLGGLISKLELPLNDHGYPIHDARGRCKTEGIYCCGDLFKQGPPSVVSALAGGATVAKAIEEDLRKE